jgi:beta-phosphoglucomutase-like phosphatase (HAD superfamily)
MRLPSYRAVIFDMDGLILDTEPLYKRAWQKAGNVLGYPIDDALYHTLVGRRTEEAMEAMREKFGADFPEERFHDYWLGEWKALVRREGIPRKAGFDELTAVIDRHGVPAAIATSTDRDRATLSLEASGLEGRFSVVVTGDEVEDGKPAPDIYLEAARRLGVPPETCIVLEDSEPGVLSADAAGMAAFMVPDMAEPSRDVREAVFRVFSSLHEAREVIEDLIIDDSTTSQSITS